MGCIILYNPQRVILTLYSYQPSKQMVSSSTPDMTPDGVMSQSHSTYLKPPSSRQLLLQLGHAPHRPGFRNEASPSWRGASTARRNPMVSLASHILRTYFGLTVQAVAECLHSRGALSFSQLVSYLSSMDSAISSHRPMIRPAHAHQQLTLSSSQIRAALLVLIQHSIVTAQSRPSSLSTKRYTYRYHPVRTICINRSAKFLEYLRKAGDAVSATVVEELLFHGRLPTVDWMAAVADHPASAAATIRTVVEATCKLVTAGFIQNIKPEVDDEEQEWTEDDTFAHREKRVKLTQDTPNRSKQVVSSSSNEGGPIVSVLLQPEVRKILPIDAVWTVNLRMFHDHLRAFYYGKYISEKYGGGTIRFDSAVPSSSLGSFVTAALKFRAFQQHTSCGTSSSSFTAYDIMKYIPKTLLQMMETNGSTDAAANIQQLFSDLSNMTNHPQIVRRLNTDQKEPVSFEIMLQSISNDYIDRIVYQIVHDRHGAIAARVVSILSSKGYLESDRLADMAMVPAKDIREVLHHLYRSRYVELFQLSNSSRLQYNPSNIIYLWGIERSRLLQRIKEDVAKALWNVRLRRQHEIEVVGQNWMDRISAQEGAESEITNETDQRNYEKFCMGLERLDVAAMHLDDTLMALCEFTKF
jgi:RNA polymerase III subunit RPC82 helix-turn-helix domain